VKVTALTKVLLQGRRFFRPFDLETKGLRRLLHPFAGLISFCGVAIVLATFIIKDLLGDEEKDVVTGLESLERHYVSGIDGDKILSRLDALDGNSANDWHSPESVADWASLNLLSKNLEIRSARISNALSQLRANSIGSLEDELDWYEHQENDVNRGLRKSEMQLLTYQTRSLPVPTLRDCPALLEPF